jgi:hypothetical protein
MKVVVSDTSPIRCLAHLTLLPVLGALYDEVLLPPAVAQELALPAHCAAPVDIAPWQFLRVQAPSNVNQVAQLLTNLDQGEAEALCLAIELRLRVVLIDERRGRAAAQRHALTPLGTLGILVQAKQQGQIPLVGPLIIRLRIELGFFVSARIEAQTLRLAGE